MWHPSEMQLVDSYVLAPGCCSICRGIDTPTIDTGQVIESSVGHEGRKYICATCAGAFAHQIGWLSPAKVAEVGAYIADLEASFNAAKHEIADRDRELALADSDIAAFQRRMMPTNRTPKMKRLPVAQDASAA